MSNHLKSFALASLVFSLTCGVGLAASDVVVKHTLAQTATSSDGKAEADKLFQDGVQQFRRGEYPKALQTYQRVLEIRRKLGDKAGEAATLNKLGEIYNGLNQPTQALEVLQQAVNLYQVIKDKAAVGEVLDNIGTSYRLKIDATKALEFYQQALAIRREVKDREGEGKTLGNIGTSYDIQEQYPKALEVLQQALTIHKEVKDRFREGYTLIRIGIVYGSLREYKRELEYYQQSLLLNRELGNRDGEFRSLFNIGFHHNNQQDYVRAVEFWQQSLVIVRELQNKSIEAITLKTIANAYYSQKQYDKAIEFYQQALAIAKQLPSNKSQEANIIAGIGDVYKIQEKYELALKYYQQALTLAREVEDKSTEAGILHVMGNIYLAQKQYNQAIKIYEEALPVAREAKDKSREANIIVGIADAYKLQNKYDQAIKFYEQALPIAREAKENLLEANIFNVLGGYYFKTEAFDLALKSYQQALSIVRKANNRPIQINILIQMMRSNYLLANQAGSKKDYTNAIKQAQQGIDLSLEGLTVAREEKDSKAEKEILSIQSQSYSLIGNYYVKLGDLQKAQEFAEQGLNIAQQSESLEAENFALSVLAGVYQSQGEQTKNIDLTQRQLEIAQKLKNPISEVQALLNISGSYLVLGNYQKAIELQEQALTKIESVDIKKLPENLQNNAWQTKSLVFWNISNAYISLGEYDKALKFAQQRLDLVQTLKKPELEASALIALGNVYAARQEFDKAVKLTQQALDIAKQIKNPEIEADALKQLGKVYVAMGKYQQANELANLLLETADKSKNIKLKLDALNILKDVYTAQGNLQKVLELLQQSLTIAKQDKDPSSEFWILAYQVIFYSSLGDYQKGLDLSQQALSIAKKVQNPQMEGMSLFLLAFLHFPKGEPQKTIELANQGLAISQKTKMIWLEMLANGVLSLGYGNLNNDQKAMESAQAFLALTRKAQSPKDEKHALTLLGQIHRKFGRKQEAIKTYNQALAIKVSAKVVGADSDIYAGLGRAYADLNQPDEAIKNFREAFTRAEEVRRSFQGLTPDLQASFWETIADFDKVKTVDVYRQYADLLLKQGRTAEAQQIYDLINVRDLREARTQAKNNSLIALGLKIQECEQKKCSPNEKSQLLDQVEAINSQYDQDLKTIEEEIRSRIAKDDGTFDPRYKSKAKEIVEAEPGTVMISTFVLEDKMWLLLTAPGGVNKAFEVKVSKEELGKAVQEFRDLIKYCEGGVCRNAEIPKLQLASQKLYNWLIKPLESELKANPVKHLIFALDRVTRYVPMSALYDGDSKQYLIEKYSVHNILSSSLTDVTKPNLQATKDAQVLAMGVSESVNKLPPLPSVQTEIDNIFKIYSGLKFLNQKFDFRTLRDNLTGKKILHLATHGEFVSNKKDKTYESFILLGTGEYLTIPKIKTLTGLEKIHLVVLSACRSALADSLEQDGIEINSTAHEFMIGGAKAVLASLWVVADKSTSEIMQEFYKNLATGKMTKSEALRQAQLSLLKGKKSQVGDDEKRAPGGLVPIAKPENSSKNREATNYSHPYYWAPFILIGNGL